jgi:chromosome segregation ATPase
MFKWLFPERRSLRDFRIESRDQAIRRLEELLAIEAGRVFVLKNQLDETCRRKGIRDEENNKLRGEVDGLNSRLITLVNHLGREKKRSGELSHEVQLKDEFIKGLQAEVDRLKWIIDQDVEANNELRKERDELKSMIDADDYAINDYVKANDELKAKVDVLRAEAEHHLGCRWVAEDVSDELRAEVECYKNANEAMCHWIKEKDETIVRLSKKNDEQKRDFEQLLEYKAKENKSLRANLDSARESLNWYRVQRWGNKGY